MELDNSALIAACDAMMALNGNGAFTIAEMHAAMSAALLRELANTAAGGR